MPSQPHAAKSQRVTTARMELLREESIVSMRELEESIIRMRTQLKWLERPYAAPAACWKAAGWPVRWP